MYSCLLAGVILLYDEERETSVPEAEGVEKGKSRPCSSFSSQDMSLIQSSPKESRIHFNIGILKTK
jgi:hypothetical protein